MRKISAHLRSNVVAYTALFFALSGSAVALQGQNTVFSDDITNGQVKTGDLADSAVNSAKILNESIASADVDSNTLTGGDINEQSLNLTNVNNAVSDTGGCSADSGTPTDCASTSIVLGRSGKLLVNATSEWHTFGLDDATGTGSDTDDPSRVAGICEIRVDDAPIGNAQPVGERSTGVSNHPSGGTMALTALSGQLGAGSHDVAVFCTEQDGDLDWSAMNMTAVRTG